MVEIYQNEELNDIMFEIEALDEWKKISEELGMDKQLEFTKSAESPIPYPWMNKSMELIFKTLCPTAVDFKKYDKTPIPLEVLKQIQLSVRDKHFQTIEIWYDDKSPDPLVVGKTHRWYIKYILNKEEFYAKNDDHSYVLVNSEQEAKEWCKDNNKEFKRISDYSGDTKKYIIARWADVIRPIKELKELAKERLLEQYGAELSKELQEKQIALKQLTENVTLYLSGDISESQLKGSRW